jgi:CxxC-x17-CxxC domain-containing protein
MDKFRKPHGNGGSFDRRGSDRLGSGSPQRQFGGSRDDRPQLFDAVCSKCGDKCQVPFRPNGMKPVYCKACFGSQSANQAGRENFARRDAPGRSPERSFEPRDSRTEDRGMFELKRQVDVLNGKVDSMLKILQAMSRVPAQAPAPAPAAATAPMILSPAILEKIHQKSEPAVKKDLSTEKVAAKKNTGKKPKQKK